MSKYDWDTIWNAIRLTYPREFRNLKGYRHVYNCLINLQPYPTDAKLQIKNLAEIPGAIDPDVFILERDRQTGDYTDYSLTMIQWQQLISLELHKGIDKTVPDLSAIAYALFKVTYKGITESHRDKHFNQLLGKSRKPDNKTRKILKFRFNKDSLIIKRWLHKATR